MRKILTTLLILFLTTSFHCFGQTAPDDEQADIKKLSIAQLLDCFDTPGPCGDNGDWDIADELVRRKYLASLLKRYWREPKQSIRRGIEYVAYRFDSHEVTRFMRKVIASKIDDGESRYYPVNYLAKKCDRNALSALRGNDYNKQNSLQWATSLELFGKCAYRPAIPFLVELVNSADLNIAIAAGDSLDKLYPSHPDLKSPDIAKQYYCRRAAAEGFKVDCSVSESLEK